MGAQGWGATGTASLAKVSAFPGESLRTEIVSLKTWCTDKCLNAHCLDPWGLFPRHPGGAPPLHCVYILQLVEGKDSASKPRWPGQAKGHSRRLVLQDTVVDWGLETHFLPTLFI